MKKTITIVVTTLLVAFPFAALGCLWANTKGYLDGYGECQRRWIEACQRIADQRRAAAKETP